MTSPDKCVPQARGIRWWPPVAIVALIGVTEWMLYLSFARSEDTTLQSVSLLASGLLCAILLTLWWLLFSRAGWKTRLGWFLLVIGVSAGTLRFEGFRGDLRPEVSFRWQSTTPNPGRTAAADVDSDAVSGTVDRFRAYEPRPTDSPSFRGANRDGIVAGHTFAPAWLQPELLWRLPVGEAWSGTTVVGPLCWSMEQRGETEVVVCRDAESGAEIWTHEEKVRFDEPMGGPGPRSTPAFEDGLIYALGATGILNCLEAATGEPQWRRNILQDAGVANLEWAMSGSPLIHGDDVVVAPGGREGRSLIAYDRRKGSIRWSGGDAIASYSSPQLATIHGLQQILIFTGDGVSGHSVTNGEVLWDYPWTAPTRINIAQPVMIGDGSVFLSTGYTKGAVLIDVARDGDRWSAEERWRSLRLKAKFNNFILHDGHVYGLDEGIMVCVDATTGRRVWKDGRYGFGQILLEPNGEVVVVQAESGEIVYVKASPDGHREIGRFQAVEGKTWNHPAIANGCLFVRNDREAACYRLEKDFTGTVAALE